MTLKGRIARLEKQRPQPVDTGEYDAFFEVFREELRSRGVDPDVVIRNGQVFVEGDSDQCVNIYRAHRAAGHVLAGEPVPANCFPPTDEPDEPLWITYGL